MERLSDLVQAALRFEQLVRLWRWSRQLKESGSHAIINASSEQFISAVEAAIARPYRRVVTYESGGIASAEYQLDLYPEARMAALLAMADDLKSERLLALVPSVVESILERWEETVPDFEETTSILSCMEDAAWSKARLDPKLYEKILPAASSPAIALLRNRKFADSPLEGPVWSEPVSAFRFPMD